MNDNIALTPQEVADLLKIAKNTVYELIKRGELNAYRVGKKVRVDMKDIDIYKNRTKKHNELPKLCNQVSDQAFLTSSATSDDIVTYKKSLIISGQDIILDILERHLWLQGISSLRSYLGSYNGLYALYQGNIHAATCHLWDGDTGIYNLPYVRRMLPGIPTVIIHLVKRTLGFYVAKGNPKKITSWDDMIRDDIVIINREKGSGTRVLLDEKLRQLGVPGITVNGYENEATSHLAVASSVSRGEADLGIGNQKAGLLVNDIDFIPVQNERFELVIKKEDFNKPHFKAIIEILRSQEFMIELQGIGGYDFSEIGTIVAEL